MNLFLHGLSAFLRRWVVVVKAGEWVGSDYGVCMHYRCQSLTPKAYILLSILLEIGLSLNVKLSS